MDAANVEEVVNALGKTGLEADGVSDCNKQGLSHRNQECYKKYEHSCLRHKFQFGALERAKLKGMYSAINPSIIKQKNKTSE